MFSIISSAVARLLSKILCHRVIDLSLCLTYALASLHVIEPDQFKLLTACFYFALAIKK